MKSSPSTSRPQQAGRSNTSSVTAKKNVTPTPPRTPTRKQDSRGEEYAGYPSPMYGAAYGLFRGVFTCEENLDSYMHLQEPTRIPLTPPPSQDCIFVQGTWIDKDGAMSRFYKDFPLPEFYEAGSATSAKDYVLVDHHWVHKDSPSGRRATQSAPSLHSPAIEEATQTILENTSLLVSTPAEPLTFQTQQKAIHPDKQPIIKATTSHVIVATSQVSQPTNDHGTSTPITSASGISSNRRLALAFQRARAATIASAQLQREPPGALTKAESTTLEFGPLLNTDLAEQVATTQPSNSPTHGSIVNCKHQQQNGQNRPVPTSSSSSAFIQPLAYQSGGVLNVATDHLGAGFHDQFTYGRHSQQNHGPYVSMAPAPLGNSIRQLPMKDVVPVVRPARASTSESPSKTPIYCEDAAHDQQAAAAAMSQVRQRVRSGSQQNLVQPPFPFHSATVQNAPQVMGQFQPAVISEPPSTVLPDSATSTEQPHFSTLGSFEPHASGMEIAPMLESNEQMWLQSPTNFMLESEQSLIGAPTVYGLPVQAPLNSQSQNSIHYPPSHGVGSMPTAAGQEAKHNCISNVASSFKTVQIYANSVLQQQLPIAKNMWFEGPQTPGLVNNHSLTMFPHQVQQQPSSSPVRYNPYFVQNASQALYGAKRSSDTTVEGRSGENMRISKRRRFI